MDQKAEKEGLPCSQSLKFKHFLCRDCLDKNVRGAKICTKAWCMKEKIISLATKYNLKIIYAFGSRAKDALHVIEGRMRSLPCTSSDLDIGIKPERPLTVEEKVEIALFFE